MSKILLVRVSISYHLRGRGWVNVRPPIQRGGPESRKHLLRTSITIPDIICVVDTGLARVKKHTNLEVTADVRLLSTTFSVLYRSPPADLTSFFVYQRSLVSPGGSMKMLLILVIGFRGDRMSVVLATASKKELTSVGIGAVSPLMCAVSVSGVHHLFL